MMLAAKLLQSIGNVQSFWREMPISLNMIYGGRPINQRRDSGSARIYGLIILKTARRMDCARLPSGFCNSRTLVFVINYDLGVARVIQHDV